MKLTLGRKGDYSVRAIIDIARHGDQGRRKAREVASAMDIPERYLGQILAQLVREGLLVASAGPDGGYQLARPPAEVTLLEVVEAVEGPVGLDQCVLSGGPCDWVDTCPIHPTWSRAQAAFKEELRGTNFADFSEIDKAIEVGTYQAPSDAPPHAKTSPRRGTR